MGILMDIATSTAPSMPVNEYLQQKANSGQEFMSFYDDFTATYPQIRPADVVDGYEEARHRLAISKMYQDQAMSARQNESTLSWLNRNEKIPFVSAIQDLVSNEKVKESMQRIQSGNATPEDQRRVALYDADRKIEHDESIGEAIGKSALHIPALVGEMGVGGKIVGGVGKGISWLGRGGKAATTAAEVAPEVAPIAASVGRTTYAGATQQALTTGAKHVGKSIPLAATMPSTYLEGASQRSMQNGGEWYDLRKNLGPAYLMGVAQTAVLGTLQGKTGNTLPGFATRVGAKTAVGMGEQVAADTINGLLIDEWMGQKGGYGVTGELFRAKTPDEQKQAQKHLIVQMATFAMFASMHSGKRYSKDSPAPWIPEFKDYMKSLKESGKSEKDAVAEASGVIQKFNDMNSNGATSGDLINYANNVAKENPQLHKLLTKMAGEMQFQGGVKTSPGPSRLEMESANNELSKNFAEESRRQDLEASLQELRAAYPRSEMSQREQTPFEQFLKNQLSSTDRYLPKYQSLAEHERPIIMHLKSIAREFNGDFRATYEYLKRRYDVLSGNKNRSPGSKVSQWGESVLRPEQLQELIKVQKALGYLGRNELIKWDSELGPAPKEWWEESDVDVGDVLTKGEETKQQSFMEGQLRKDKKLEADLEKQLNQELGAPGKKWKDMSPKERDALIQDTVIADLKKKQLTDGEENSELIAKLMEMLEGTPAQKKGKLRRMRILAGPLEEGRDLDTWHQELKNDSQAQTKYGEMGRPFHEDSSPEELKQHIIESFRNMLEGKKIKTWEDFNTGGKDHDAEYEKYQREQEGLPPASEERVKELERALRLLRGEHLPEPIPEEKPAPKTSSEPTGELPEFIPLKKYKVSIDDKIAQAKKELETARSPIDIAFIKDSLKDYMTAKKNGMKEYVAYENDGKPPKGYTQVEIAGVVGHLRTIKGLTAREQQFERIARELSDKPPDTYHSNRWGGPTRQTQPSASEAASMPEVVAEIQKLTGVIKSVGKVPYDPTAAAFADTNAGTVIVGKGDTTNARSIMEDYAHILTGRHYLNIETDPAKLKPDIRDGLESFDGGRHIQGKGTLTPTVTKETMVEGIAAWAVRRMEDKLTNLTPNEQAAAQWLESQFKPYIKQLDKIKDKYLSNVRADPITRAGKLIGTGKPAESELTTGEEVSIVASEIKDNFVRAWENQYHDMARIRREMVKSGKSTKDIDKAIATWSVYNESSIREIEGLIEKSGYFTFDQDGKRVWSERNLDYLVKGLDKNLIKTDKPGIGMWGKIHRSIWGDDRASMLDTFIIANHLVESNGRMPNEKYVSDDQLFQFKDFIIEVAKDKKVFDQLQEAHRRYVEIFADSLNLLADKKVHYISEQHRDALLHKHPWYAPLIKVLQVGESRGRGDMFSKRNLSDQQIQAPLISLKQRQLEVAALYTRQMRLNSMMEVLKNPNMARWADTWEIEGPTAEGLLKEQEIANLKAQGKYLEARSLEDTTIANDFVFKPWQDGGDKLIYWRQSNGKLMSIKIKDKHLYNMMTDRTVEASFWASLLNKIADFNLGQLLPDSLKKNPFFEFPGRIKPFSMPTQFIRHLATASKPAFQWANVLRDAFHGMTATKYFSDPVRYSAEVMNSLFRAYRAEWGIQFAGGEATKARDQWFMEITGRASREVPYSPNRSSDVYRILGVRTGPIETAKNMWDFFKKVVTFTGAGESAVRMREAFKYLESRGYSEAFIEAQLKKHPNSDPVPHDVMVDAIYAAQEMTNFGRKGAVSGELSKMVPFFSASIAGIRRDIKSAVENPKRYLFVAALALGARLMHYYTYRDEEWWDRLSPYDKYGSFAFPVGKSGKIVRLPGPRDMHVPIGATTIAMLDQARGRDPQWGKVVDTTFKSMLPPGIGESAAMFREGDVSSGLVKLGTLPLGPIAQTYGDVAMNRQWTGAKLVPVRDEPLSKYEKFKQYEAPYIANQLTAGRTKGDLLSMLGLNFTPEIRSNEVVADLYKRIDELKSGSTQAKRSDKIFEDKAELNRLEKASREIIKLNAEARGETKRPDGRIVFGEKATEQRRREIRQLQAQIAKKALSGQK